MYGQVHMSVDSGVSLLPPPAEGAAGLRPLPRGRRVLPHDLVASAQRHRALVAIVDAVAGKGFGATTIADIVSGAGLSRATFYEHFRDKEECFLAAYDLGAQTLYSAVVSAAQVSNPLAQLERAMEAYLGALAAAPTWARSFLIEIGSAGPAARRRAREVNGWYADLLRRWRRTAAPALRPPPPPRGVYEACVAAVNELVVLELEERGAAGLRSLKKPALYIQRCLLGVVPPT